VAAVFSAGSHAGFGAYVSLEEAFVINRGAADAIASPASLVLGAQEKKNFN
jgi:hypothetical protein